MRSTLPWFCSLALACALPVAEDPQLERDDQALAHAGRGMLCKLPIEKPTPGKPSCPECLVQPVGDDEYVLRIPRSLQKPVYLGDPYRPDEALEVWSGDEPVENGTLRLIVPWHDPHELALPGPIPSLAGPAMFVLANNGCAVVLAPHDESLTPQVESVGTD